MQFYHGAAVFSADGKEAARVDRVVIDPQTNLVTHLVLRKGWLFSADKVAPMELVTAGADGAIVLQLKAEQLSELSDFEEKQYLVVDEHALSSDLKPDALVPAPSLYWNPSYPEPPMVTPRDHGVISETRLNIPEGTVAIKPGAKVVSSAEKPIGHIDMVLMSPAPERVTHVLISHGLLLMDHKLVPVRWIDQWHGDEVRLAITSKMFDSLPSFELAH
jgi:uncharacterized protein YrrD